MYFAMFFLVERNYYSRKYRRLCVTLQGWGVTLPLRTVFFSVGVLLPLVDRVVIIPKSRWWEEEEARRAVYSDSNSRLFDSKPKGPAGKASSREGLSRSASKISQNRKMDDFFRVDHR